MLPSLYGVSVYFAFWVLAAFGAIFVAHSMTTAAGLPRRSSLAALVVSAIVIIIGAKLYFLAGFWFFPSPEAAIYPQEQLAAVLRQGYRIPGGILLLAAALPIICGLFKLPTLRFADAMMPAVGVAVVFVRLGCFMNGCCYGMVTHGPLGVRFPIGSKAYEMQLLTHEIAWPADHTLPVHPLQLYYALAGLMLYFLARHWQATKQYDGEVWLKSFAYYYGTTFLLEFLRWPTVYINLVVPPIVSLIALVWMLRARQGRTVAAHTAP